jgi:hypothetical protein
LPLRVKWKKMTNNAIKTTSFAVFFSMKNEWNDTVFFTKCVISFKRKRCKKEFFSKSVFNFLFIQSSTQLRFWF